MNRTMSMKHINIATLLAIVLWLALLPQISSAGWERAYGFPWAHDYGREVIQMRNKDYLIAGFTLTLSESQNDLYLVRTDSIGNLLWERTYGGADDDFGYCTLPTEDEEFFVVGETESFGSGGSDGWLLKLTADGDTLWTKTYGTIEHDCFTSADLCQDGLILTGYTYSAVNYSNDVWVVKTNFSGDIIWTKEHGGYDDDICYSVKTTKDEEFILTGSTNSSGVFLGEVYNLKLDSEGDTIWTRTFGGYINEEGYSVVQSTDSGFVIAGYTNSFGSTSDNVLILKLNSDGDTMWYHSYGTPEHEIAYSISTTLDGGFVATGYIGNDIWLLKLNETGDTLWTRTFGGTGGEIAHCVRQTSDGGFIIAGCTGSFTATGEVYLIKTDSLGNVDWIREPGMKPQNISLNVYPNPFNSSCQITVDVGAFREKPLQIEIFDLRGNLVGALNLTPLQNGAAIWQPDEEIGSGIYLVRATMGEKTVSKKIVYLR